MVPFLNTLIVCAHFTCTYQRNVKHHIQHTMYHGFGVFPLQIKCTITGDTPMGGAIENCASK